MVSTSDRLSRSNWSYQPPADRMAQVVPVQPDQRFQRFIGGAGLSCLGLGDQGLGDLRLRPQPPGEFPDIPFRVALIDQAPRRAVTIAKCRGKQLRAIPAGRAARDPLKALQ